MLQVEKMYLEKLSEAVYRLLKGKSADPVELPQDYPDNELKQVVGYINKFICDYGVFNVSMDFIAKGVLDFDIPKGGTAALNQLKGLQASLRHLTWKTQQIAAGDFEQKVDFMGDFSAAFNSMTLQLKEAFQKIERQNEQLQEAFEMLSREKDKSERLLLNILPVRVANDLKATGRTEPRTYENVTVFFSDIVGFTSLSSQLEPKALIDELNEIFTGFDMIVEQHDCERIKTIGDAYLAVGGMNSGYERHAENIVAAALQIVKYLEDRNRTSPMQWEIRIGIHSGKVVGGVVGIKKYIFDVFGDTINTACRMEQNSEPMKINASEATARLIQGKYTLSERGELEVKGKGLMRMFYVSDITAK